MSPTRAGPVEPTTEERAGWLVNQHIDTATGDIPPHEHQTQPFPAERFLLSTHAYRPHPAIPAETHVAPG